MAAKKDRSVTFEAVPGFNAEFRKFSALDAGIEERMREFYRAKAQFPPVQLPRTMRDHKLDGPLSAFEECHLGGDILLIYQHADDVVTLCAVCRHADLHGGKTLAKKLAARLK